MTAWLDAPASSCDHWPNARGTACQHCGLTAELVTPDELADALTAELAAARLRAGGQLGWVETCNACDAMGPVHPVTGYCEPCQTEANDPRIPDGMMLAPNEDGYWQLYPKDDR